MDNTCKTLTVSYGAFSFTLEKLSDPVEALKLIKDNFRDLVAGDRYFGSEPRTPNDQGLAKTGLCCTNRFEVVLPLKTGRI
jgi:hypothetical protein